MSAGPSKTVLAIGFEDAEIQAIDAWISRHDDPRPCRADAVRHLVATRLGLDLQGHLSSVIPDEFTGRDIV